jgi:hypothetical protein
MIMVIIRPTSERRIRLTQVRSKFFGFRACLLLAGLFAVAAPHTASAWQEVVLVADRDNTLYETEMDAGEVQNEFSNGAGSFLFAGRTNFDAVFRLRRGLIRFDLSTLPAGSEILSAELTLYQSNVPPGAFPITVSLHRVLQDWGEGAADGIGPEGQGAPAQPGDATWFHRFYDTATWTDPGGTFAISASASATVGAALGDYSWNCTSGLVGDIQAWVDDSNASFGWIVIGGEEGGGTARRFNSTNNAQLETRPRLRVVYRSPEFVFADGFESAVLCE